MNKSIIAIMYDFDKTLCTKDMQEYGFIPKLGLSPKDFWAESNKLASENNMDRILAYMYLMKKKADAHDIPISRADFVNLGKGVEFFPGVADWFNLINEYGRNAGATIEHYIISSGLKEIIEGSAIAPQFKKIYACEFLYNVNGVAVWPAVAVNYTGKTQFLFRINKGVPDINDDASLNRFVEDDKRPVPFRNMIYIGDGLTDVPCMKLVKVNGGQSIAVYPPNKDKRQVQELLTDRRVDFIAPADYREGRKLNKLVTTIIDKMVASDRLVTLQGKELARRRVRRSVSGKGQGHNKA